MVKKLIILSVLFITVFLMYQNWDIIFSESQHLFYSLIYMNFSTVQNGSLIEKHTISSDFLKKQIDFNVYLPKNYYSQSHMRYPVLFLLHGYPGTDNDWLINTNLQKRLDEKIKSKKIPALIVVFPDMNGPIIRDSQYLNATKVDQKMESYFIKELIPYVDSHFNTLKSREHRAIGGISSGGYGALYLGLKYNDLFSYIFSHSGYMTNNEPVMNRLIDKIQTNRNAYNPLFLINKVVLQKPLFIYFDIGKNEKRSFLKDTYAFNTKLDTLHIFHTMKITEGIHGWKLWGINIDNSLDYLNLIKLN